MLSNLLITMYPTHLGAPPSTHIECPSPYTLPYTLPALGALHPTHYRTPYPTRVLSPLPKLDCPPPYPPRVPYTVNTTLHPEPETPEALILEAKPSALKAVLLVHVISLANSVHF